jgi:hypothetical protein
LDCQTDATTPFKSGPVHSVHRDQRCQVRLTSADLRISAVEGYALEPIRSIVFRPPSIGNDNIMDLIYKLYKRAVVNAAVIRLA